MVASGGGRCKGGMWMGMTKWLGLEDIFKDGGNGRDAAAGDGNSGHGEACGLCFEVREGSDWLKGV